VSYKLDDSGRDSGFHDGHDCALACIGAVGEAPHGVCEDLIHGALS
jgi:hypothetical protein